MIIYIFSKYNQLLLYYLIFLKLNIIFEIKYNQFIYKISINLINNISIKFNSCKLH